MSDKLTVVTACEDKYKPGVVALWNSIKKNVPEGEIDFYCMYYGEDAEDLKAKGINVIDNYPFPDDQVFPIGGRWQKTKECPDGLNPSPYAMPAMYARLLITKVFPGKDRIFWVDADCIVLKSFIELKELDFKGTPVAGIDISNSLNGNFLSLYPNRSMGQQNGNSLGHDGFGCGVMLVNTKVWEEKKITEKSLSFMNECQAKNEMLAVVQSILILVVKGDFVPLSEDQYLFNIRRGKPPHQETKIIHFAIMIPWDPFDMAQKPPQHHECVRQYWKPYA